MKNYIFSNKRHNLKKVNPNYLINLQKNSSSIFFHLINTTYEHKINRISGLDVRFANDRIDGPKPVTNS